MDNIDRNMNITILGSGPSQGIPVIGCRCKVCQSDDEKDKRLRSSIAIEVGNTSIVVDSGPDFRQQMLVNQINKLSAIVFTHNHKDHTGGLDDVRAYNYIQKAPIDVFARKKYPGIPKINLTAISEKAFDINDISIQPIRIYHHLLPMLGFRIGNFAYLTDIKSIPQSSIEKLKGLDTLIVTALREKPHISHFNLEEALEMIDTVKPKRSFLTHISHDFGKHEDIESKLPYHVRMAYDGLVLYERF